MSILMGWAVMIATAGIMIAIAAHGFAGEASADGCIDYRHRCAEAIYAGTEASDAALTLSDAALTLSDAALTQSDAALTQSDAALTQSDAALTKSDADIDKEQDPDQDTDKEREREPDKDDCCRMARALTVFHGSIDGARRRRRKPTHIAIQPDASTLCSAAAGATPDNNGIRRAAFDEKALSRVYEGVSAV